MKFIRRHWYNIGMLIALVLIITLPFTLSNMNFLQIVLYLNFIVILIHQFEEYGFPGGEPVIMNSYLQTSSKPNRYPLNQNSAMVTNVVCAYIFYLLPVFFHNIIWLGLAPILFGLSQFIVHGIITPKKIGRFYNPGLGAVIIGHIPLAIIYIYYIIANNLGHWYDWIIGIIYMFAVAGIIVGKMTYDWLADENSQYPFDPVEMKRFKKHIKN